MLLNRYKNQIRVGLGALGLVFLSGCELLQVSQNKFKATDCSAIGACSSSSSGNSPSVSPSSPFGLSIKSYWDSDTNKLYPRQETQLYHVKKASGEYLNTGTEDDLDKTDPCNIKAETDLNSAPEDRHRTCGLLIPETRLYFSRLEFTLNIASSSGCEVVYFTPLSYRASASKDFQSAWSASKLDCSLTNASPPIGCFSGPGIKLSGFPGKTGIVSQLTNNSIANTFTWTAESAFENSRGDNRWSAHYPFEPGLGRWQFECVNEGSDQNFNYILRIIPTRDPGNDVGENWSRYLGWVDENGVYNGSGF